VTAGVVEVADWKSDVDASPRAATPVVVHCIDNADDFAALRGEWTELLLASASNNPFLTWEWLHTWWMQLGGGSALHLIAVREGDQLIAIAPLRLVSTALYWFSRLEFLGTGHAGSDYLDVIVRRGREEEALAGLAGYLQSRQLAVRLTHLPPASFGARLAQTLAGAGWVAPVSADGTCPIVPLAGQTFDSYLGTLGSSHRANFRRRLRSLGQRFELRFERVTTDEERREALDALAAFHDSRWKDGSTAFSTPAVRAFQDAVTRRALECGWLRMYVLRLNGYAAAVMYGVSYGGRFYFYQHGFDSEYQTHSVGLVLMGLTIRAALEEGDGEFDLLWGVEPYKFLWARDARHLQRVELFPVHLGGTIHRCALQARRGVSKLARRVLSSGDSRV
jgi:CelD/BcsL family acetyltransferase involved in cellulose biosynthesis